MKVYMCTPLRVFEILVLTSCINFIYGQRFADENYYPVGFYDNQQRQYEMIKTALKKLDNEPEWVKDWPDPSVKLGQVSGVALDNEGRLLVFHRASNVWDATTFSNRNVYQRIGEPPIPHHTILTFNDTGELVDMWGQNLFYIPHGITVDPQGNVWVTDVALHQVFKFKPDLRDKPAMVLGDKFVPGRDDMHFCKPSAVAVLANGDFFVADGYCNHRILKFSPEGSIILQWGTSNGDSPFVLNVPHALTLAEEQQVVCVADREHGRVPCFRADNGTFVQHYRSWLIGSRLFSVAYSPVHGGRLYVVNGPNEAVPVRGYVIDYQSGKLLQTFAPANPHDIVVSPDGSKVYVAELNPYKVYKFVDETLRNESRVNKKTNSTVHVKPTATVEVAGVSVAGSGGEWWRGALGGAGGAAVAALLALAALVPLRARNNGKGYEAEPLVTD
ncbi:peptidyl-alpha-hydroxyglycine alpha-amidating lyase 1 [Manduca sexta]|uniref:peptidyl-alpha-hydroxyglycine alpha-amidating lyase 1 n=1 Tax=Manduca sexta TaxID=7130 RepID=UPI00188F95B8|nr:peptidyl-alpha-hydroxyglycine alpha-amidating lyase 1 [Manduca sexta]